MTQKVALWDIFFFNDTATTEIYTLSLHDALPICYGECRAEPHRYALVRRLRRDAGRDDRWCAAGHVGCGARAAGGHGERRGVRQQKDCAGQSAETVSARAAIRSCHGGPFPVTPCGGGLPHFSSLSPR